MLLPLGADAQTWVSGRTAPALREIVSVDATGEPDWPFGAEDVAGDGLDTFQQQEANVDIRSLYAVADGERLWVRLHVSDTGGAGSNVVAFLFVDVDADAATGGGADATGVRAEFVDDPSGGGYERIVGFSANESVLGVWNWDGAAWIDEPDAVTSVDAESATDVDQLLLGDDTHGYLQANVLHGVTGLDASCDAMLFVRTWNDVPSQDYGDLNVGERAPCLPADGDGDRIPDVIEGSPCDADDDCPGDGICADGVCIPGNPCGSDADCRSDETCVDGQCVPTGGEPCSPPGDPCGDGWVCAPNGLCVDPDDWGGDADTDVDADADGDTDGFALDGGRVQGGACTCRATAPAGSANPRSGGGSVAFLLLLGLLRRRA